MADEMLGEFIHEASEHLANAAGLLLGLTRSTQVDAEQVNACFRSLHTVKGCAGFLDLHRIKGVAHAGEQVLDALRSGTITGAPATWDILLATVTRLEELLRALEKDQLEPPGSDQDIIADLEAVLIPAGSAAPALMPAAASSPQAAAENPASITVDACVAGIIASDPSDRSEIRRQFTRLERVAARDAWTGDLRAALVSLGADVARLEAGEGDAAMADIYVHVQAVQDLSARLAAQPPPTAPASIPAVAAAGDAAAEKPAADGAKPRDLLQDFVSESLELLSYAEGVGLAKTACDDEQINGVFRSFHTIKGMAAYLQQPAIERAAHAIEERLLPVRDGQAPADKAFRELILTGVDQLRGLLAAVRQGSSSGMLPASTTTSTEIRIGDLLVDMGVSREVVEQTAKQLKPNERIGDKLVEAGQVSRQVVDQAVQQQAASRAGDGFSRVATSKLEEMVNMVGELLIAQAMVVHDPELARFANLGAAVQRQSRILRSLQVLSLSLRMVPLRATFQKMARAVHDTARKLGKTIDWQTGGEDTEIDRTLAEAMADPLLHMVRNAVDHGIEAAATRTANGKSANGTVRLEAFHAGDNVVIQLTDDGAGMDPQRLRRKAIEKGLIAADRAMTDAECFDLVFLPGFSTAAKVTDVSGRGVGMDVVRRQVRNANGTVQISSTLGKGSVFTIRLPLTTAIMDTMLLRVGEQRFLIPVASVVSMLRPAPGQVETVMRHGRVLNNRGHELPVVSLGEVYGIADHQNDPQQSLLLVVENRGRDFALQVDEVLGQRQVVIKPFDHSLAHHPGVSGSAILGDGRVALILNPARLLSGSGSDEPA